MASRSTRTRKGRSAPARDLRVVLSSAPARDAKRLADLLVERRLAACVTLVPAARSTYRWKGRVETARETVLLVKTTAGRLAACLATLAEAHPYEVPEALAFAPARGLSAYAAWTREATRGARD